MPEVAGKVNVVLSVNAVNFTAAMKGAQKELDQFAGKSKQAGHATVNSTQAASAALRVMQGDMTNNIRAVERFVGAIPGVGNALKIAFPLVGGIAFASLVVNMGMEVAAFIKQVDEMPKAIQKGFEALNLSQKTANDSMYVSNDKLQNAIDKLENKPINSLKLGMDEATLSADHLAESISGASDKLNDLLSKNHINGMQALWGFMGTKSTAGVEGAAQSYAQQISTASNDYANNPTEENHQKMLNLIQSQKKEAAAAFQNEIAQRDAPQTTFEKFMGFGTKHKTFRPDNRSIISDEAGIVNSDDEQLRNDSGITTQTKLQKQKDSDDARKAAQEQAKKETDAAKKAATERVAAMQTSLNAMKLQYGMSIKAVYDYWDGMKAGETAGGTAYNAIGAKQTQLAVQAATEAHSKIEAAKKKFLADNADNATTGVGLINSAHQESQRRAEKASNNQDADARSNNQQSILEANNAARIKETQINEDAGDSMTRYAAAVALANVHAEQLKATLLALGANVDIAQRNYDQANTPGGDPDKIRQAKSQLDQAKNAKSGAETSGQIQDMQDKQALDPGFTSATTGAKDALNDFVMASRDSASMMRELVTNTLNSLNDQIANAAFGDKTNFGQVVKNAGKEMMNDSLKKVEGNAFSALGFGNPTAKFGESATKPMFVSIVESAAGGASKAATGIFGKLFGKKSDDGDDSDSGGDDSSGGGFKSFISSIFGKGHADGGSIDGPSLVGERGPELFVPSGKGTIIPNHKMSTMAPGSSGGSYSYTIDARGTDPEQTEARVRTAIAQSHDSSVHQSLQQSHQRQLRTPRRSK